MSASQPVAAAVHVVVLDGMVFTPSELTIYQGDTVQFVNTGGSDNLHNVRADDNSFWCSLDCNTHHSPSTQPWVANVRFNRLRTTGYFCEQHGDLASGMRGRITVIDRVFVDGFDPSAP